MLPFAYCSKGACPLSLCAHATQILRKGDECLTVQNAVSFLCAALSTQPFFTQLRLGPCGKDAVVTGITPCTLRRLGLYSWRESNPHGCSPADFESAVYTNSTTGAKRRGWDSNPCAQKDKRFSRPPRYDRFDTSPYQASSFVRTRLQRGLPNALMIIHSAAIERLYAGTIANTAQLSMRLELISAPKTGSPS